MRSGPGTSKPELHTRRDWLRVMLCGMGMGVADLVPGFSGGTVAFLTGIYPDLLASIVSFNARALKALASLRLTLFFHIVAWEFLLALGMGIALSAGSLVRVIHYILGDPELRVYLFSAFSGLVLASASICARQVSYWRAPQFAALLGGGLLAFVITSLPLAQANDDILYDVSLPQERIAIGANTAPITNYDRKAQRLLAVPETTLVAMLSRGVVEPNTPAYSHGLQREGAVQDFVKGRSPRHFDPWLVLCGAIAICALLLPGMSGCYMLMILGAYPIFIGALSDLVNGLLQLTIDIDALWIFVSLATGVIIGLIGFSRVVRWLLHHYRNITVAAITGFMIGAIRAVWPFWSYDYHVLPLRLQEGPQLQLIAPILPDMASGTFWLALVFAGAGLAVVLVLDAFTKHHERLPAH